MSKVIETYLNIAKNSADLSKDLELQYVKKAKKNIKFKELLFNAHLKMVIGIAQKYAGGHTQVLEDLIGAGLLGLDKALSRFKPKMKVRFNTYARWWVRAHILKFFGDNVRSMLVPDKVSVEIFKINKVIEKLSQVLARDPTNAEVADELNYDVAYVATLRKFLLPNLSLDSQLVNKERNVFTTIKDNIADNRDHAGESLIRVDGINKIKQAIQKLPDRERYVIENRFGLNDKDELTLQEVGKKMGLTAERVRQIQLMAEKRLKKIMES